MFWQPFLRWYLKRDRRARFGDFNITVRKGVFHPRFFFSSQFLCGFIATLDLHRETFLEIGCGSGVVSMTAYSKGAKVTAVDINAAAVENTRENFRSNFKGAHLAEIFESDLFEKLGNRKFNVIAVNPPYYFQNANSAAQHAWNAGNNGDYFTRLFAGLHKHLDTNGKCYMVISDAADLARVQALAKRERVKITPLKKEKVRWETNLIWEISPAG